MAAKMKNTILIVDEDPDIVYLTERFLNMGGFDTITSNKAKKALKIIEENYDKIDLVLVNIMISGRGGYNVLETAKFKKIPVEFIPKTPFSGKELVNRVRRFLSGEKVERRVRSNWASNGDWYPIR